jgi:hypothetical protein
LIVTGTPLRVAVEVADMTSLLGVAVWLDAVSAAGGLKRV